MATLVKTPEQKEADAAKARSVLLDTLLTSGLPTAATMAERRQAEQEAAQATVKAAEANAAVIGKEAAKVPQLLEQFSADAERINQQIAAVKEAKNTERSVQEEKEIAIANEAQGALATWKNASSKQAQDVLQMEEKNFLTLQAEAAKAQEAANTSTGLWGWIKNSFMAGLKRAEAEDVGTNLTSLKRQQVASAEVLANTLLSAKSYTEQVMAGRIATAVTQTQKTTNELLAMLDGRKNMTDSLQAISTTLSLSNENVRAVSQKWQALKDMNVTDMNAYMQVLGLAESQQRSRLLDAQMKKMIEDPAGTALFTQAIKKVEQVTGRPVNISPAEWAQLSSQERLALPGGPELAAAIDAVVSVNSPISKYQQFKFAGEEASLSEQDKVAFKIGMARIEEYNEEQKKKVLGDLTGDALRQAEEELKDPKSARAQQLAALMMDPNNEQDWKRADKITREALADLSRDATVLLDSGVMQMPAIEAIVGSPAMKDQFMQMLPDSVKQLIESGEYTKYSLAASTPEDIAKNEEGVVAQVLKEFTKPDEVGNPVVNYKAAEQKLTVLADLMAAQARFARTSATSEVPLLTTMSVSLRNREKSGGKVRVNLEDSGVIRMRLKKALVEQQSKNRFGTRMNPSPFSIR